MFLLFAAIAIFITTFFIVNSIGKRALSKKIENLKEGEKRNANMKRTFGAKRALVDNMKPLPRTESEKTRTSSNVGVQVNNSYSRNSSKENKPSVRR